MLYYNVDALQIQSQSSLDYVEKDQLAESKFHIILFSLQIIALIPHQPP